MPDRALLSVLLFLTACASARRGVDAAEASAGGRLTADNTSCVAAFDSLQAIFRRDYPGYRVKVAGHEAELDALTDSVRAIARTSDHHIVCIPALWRWTGFFHDPHIMLWQAAAPSPEGSNGADRSSAPDDDIEGRPSLRFVNDSTAVLRLPDFDLFRKPAIDSLVAANRAMLLATQYLVVDVRGNGGGCTCSFDSVIPLLYTGPIFRYGADVWASQANVEYVRSWLAMDEIPAETKARVRTVLPELVASPDQFVTFMEDGELRLDTVYSMPREVAVVVDKECASSCENFVLDALQSDKVTVLGSGNTRGTGDYGNIRSVWLPGWRRLRIPTTRSRRLLGNPPLDNVGIAPEVRIPEGESEVVNFAVRFLYSSDRTNP